MWQTYWRNHGPQLLGGSAAHVAGWGGVWLADQLQFDLLAIFGFLLLIGSTIVLIVHAFLPITIAILVVLAVLTLVGLMLAALAQLLHPALLVVLGIAATSLGVVFAGSWWGAHGDGVLAWLGSWHQRGQVARPFAARVATPGPARLRLTRIENPIPMNAAPRRNRRCRVCGLWINAAEARCGSQDCPSNQENRR